PNRTGKEVPMKLLRNLVLLGVVLAAVAAMPHPAAAQVNVIQTRCDTLSFDPPLVRVTFAVVNFTSIPLCSVHLTPVTIGRSNADSCRIIECSVPNPGWLCQLDPAGGAIWHTVLGYPCLNFGDKVENLDVILD